jgi:hypothetical protein
LKRKPVSSSVSFLAALDVQAQVVRLGELLDQVGQLAAAPILDPVHLAAAGGDEALVAFQHGRNLFALIRMDQQNDSHSDALMLLQV